MIIWSGSSPHADHLSGVTSTSMKVYTELVEVINKLKT